MPIDPPWRLDPFQNIVNVSWGGFYVLIYVGVFAGTDGSGHSITGAADINVIGKIKQQFSAYYDHGTSKNLHYTSGL